jgi:hypothetical protein
MHQDDFVDVALYQVQKALRGGLQQGDDTSEGSGPASSLPLRSAERRDDSPHSSRHQASSSTAASSTPASHREVQPAGYSPHNVSNVALSMKTTHESSFSGVGGSASSSEASQNVAVASPSGPPPIAPKLQQKPSSTLSSLASSSSSGGTKLRDEASLLLRVVEEQRGIIYDLTAKNEALSKHVADRDGIIQSRDGTIRELRALVDTADRRLLDAQHMWDSEKDALEARHLKQQEALLVKLLGSSEATQGDTHSSQVGVTDSRRWELREPSKPSANSAATTATSQEHIPRAVGHHAATAFNDAPESASHSQRASAMAASNVPINTHEIHVQTLPETFSAAVQTMTPPSRPKDAEARQVVSRRILSSPPRDEAPNVEVQSTLREAVRQERVQPQYGAHEQPHAQIPAAPTTYLGDGRGSVLAQEPLRYHQPHPVAPTYAAVPQALASASSYVHPLGQQAHLQPARAPQQYTGAVYSSSFPNDPYAHSEPKSSDNRSWPHPVPSGLSGDFAPSYTPLYPIGGGQQQLQGTSAYAPTAHHSYHHQHLNHTPVSSVSSHPIAQRQEYTADRRQSAAYRWDDAPAGSAIHPPPSHQPSFSSASAPANDVWSLRYGQFSSKETGHRVAHLLDRIYGLQSGN